MSYYNSPPPHGATGPAPMYPGYYSGYAPSGYPMRLRSLRGFAVALQVLLGVQAVSVVAVIVAALGQRSLMDQIRNAPGTVTFDQVTDADSFVATANLLHIALFIATGVVWIVWLYCARLNVNAWGGMWQRMGSGWVIGAWFVPIGNLFIPAKVTRDIFDGTDSIPGYRTAQQPQPIVSTWASLYAITAVLTSAVYVKFKATHESAHVTVDDVTNNVTWLLLAQGASLLAIAAAFALVRSLTRRQHARMATGQAG